MEELTLNYKLLDGAIAPTKSFFWDGGWDFYANEDVVLKAGCIDTIDALKQANSYRHNRVSGHDVANIISRLTFSPAPITKVNLGVCIDIPKEYVGIMFDRSGMAIKLHIGHVAGVIDCGYNGELTAGLVNLGNRDYKIKRGDKVIQMVFFNTPLFINWNKVDELQDTERGAKGFGSSGK